MNNKISGWDDTIAALATPPGKGAIGVIRVSGNKTFDIVNRLFPSKDLEKQKSHTLHVGYLKENEHLLDEVVISLFKGPQSYTGEDVIEISCHGSPYVQEQVLQALYRRGARPAKAGEFTQRAFLHGKMDLAQAEAVADLIASETEAAKLASIRHMRGGFSNELSATREQLLQFSSLIELELDFSQEDVEFADRQQFFDLLFSARKTVSTLLDSFTLGNVIKNGIEVAITGKPNAGKSTLLNSLLNEERAIVSDIEGTTRDTIEETLNINGILFRLVDTAGIREHTADIIEGFGIERSLRKMQQADIVLYLFDVTTGDIDSLKRMRDELKSKSIHYILIGNKAENQTDVEKYEAQIPDEEMIFISAKTRVNINLLKDVLFQKAVSGESLQTDQTVVTNSRHVTALREVHTALEDIIEGMRNGIPGDLLSLDIRRCLFHLGEITGEITNEEQLDYIFSKFCIGK